MESNWEVQILIKSLFYEVLNFLREFSRKSNEHNVS